MLVSYVTVSGEPNSLEFATPREAALQLVEFLHTDGSNIESEKIAASHLGQLEAATLVAVYSCPESGERYVQASTVALSPDRSFWYEVALYAPAGQYGRDRGVLDRLLESWRYSKR